jgi:hypothetical protein
VTTDRFGVCWPFDFDRSVPANPVPPAAANEFIAGFNNHIRPGQSCNTQESFAFSGAFGVNLAGVQNVLVTNAMLKLDRRNTPVMVHTGADNFCTLSLEVATEDWHAERSGTSFASRTIPLPAPITVRQSSSATGLNVNVTWAVQQWALGRIPNFGFVLKPRPEDIAKNENTCTGYWSNPRLDITVARPEHP